MVNKPLERLQSSEGTALGAAVVALAGIENHQRRLRKIAEPYTVADAVSQLVRFASPVAPVSDWTGTYAKTLAEFRKRIG